MKVINLSQNNSILCNFLAEIRDINVQKDRVRFRENIRHIGHIEAYEISRMLSYQSSVIKTPLADCTVNTIMDQIVIGAVLRAGLPLFHSFLDFFTNADGAFVSARRYYKDTAQEDIGVHIEYLASPSIQGKTLIITDSMLATGTSIELSYKAFLRSGTPDRLIIACVIASEKGVEYLQKIFPSDDVVLVCGTIDPELNEHKYIVPGLGDAGDLTYGEKL